MMGLTPVHNSALVAIREHIRSTGTGPSIREIGKAIGRRESATHAIIKKLEERGALRRLPNRWRTIELTDNIRLPDDLEVKLAILQRSLGVSREEAMRRALSEALERHGRVAA